uniref:Uncharacterized protein n=1 Tax=Alexandrium catenella TaxID=2925 RepID=A0A7S1RPA9_ALECA
MEALDTVLRTTRPIDHRSGSKSVRHKLLMLAAEQLGRERALLCGHLREPGSLADPSAARRVHEVIGARKLLLGTAPAGDASAAVTPLSQCSGCSQPATEVPSSVVAGELGILPALGLTDAPLIEPQELAELEDAEDRALAPSGNGALELTEWYQLITTLVDKIHQHVTLNIVDHFPQKDSSERGSSPPRSERSPHF